MKTFTQYCQDYHLAEKALSDHYKSEFWTNAKSLPVRFRFQQYLDLENWPQSPDLRGLTIQDREQLKVWGKAHEERLNAFHDQTRAINQRIFESKIGALVSLGVLAGKAFRVTAGRLDERAERLIVRFGERRKKYLDGIDYVSLLEVDGPFSKGFFRQTKLNRSEFLKDLQLLLSYRIGVMPVGKDCHRLHELLPAA